MKPPKLSSESISAVQRIITGDPVDNRGTGPLSPYQSGPKLVAFFRQFGINDEYPTGGGFPSRWAYVEEKLRQLNSTPALAEAVEAATDGHRFLDSEHDPARVAEYLNRYLEYDGYQLIPVRKRFRLRPIGESVVDSESMMPSTDPITQEFISEQVEKCDRKLHEGDYDGAITNSRSFLEAVLFEIEGRLDPNRPKYDGDLSRLSKRVQKLLNLDPARSDISESLRMVLRGLASVVNGLAPLRNKMGDAHVRAYKPTRHHAKLAINSSRTVADFLVDSFEYQRSLGMIKPTK